jgi:hypothetical protein
LLGGKSSTGGQVMLNKGVKTILGTATLLVTLLPLLIAVVWLAPTFGLLPPEATFDVFEFAFQRFEILTAAICVINLAIYALVAFYIIHLVRNKHMSETAKIVIAVTLFFIPYLAMPAYFLIYVWPERSVRQDTT